MKKTQKRHREEDHMPKEPGTGLMEAASQGMPEIANKSPQARKRHGWIFRGPAHTLASDLKPPER